MIIMLVYILGCLLIAILGKKLRFGFWGYFFLSIFLTPIAGLIALIAAVPTKDPCEECYEKIKKFKDNK